MIKAVADALRPERPENVRLYCKVADINEIINRLVSWFLVGVINQTRTAAVTVGDCSGSCLVYNLSLIHI